MRIDQILEAKRDPDFYQRILRRADWRQRTRHFHMTLSKLHTSALFVWLRQSIELQLGKTVDLAEFEEILEIQRPGYGDGNYIKKYMRFADCASAEVVVNGTYRATVVQNGFALPALRGLRFDNARTFIAVANIKASFHEKAAITQEMLGWLDEICEEQIAATILSSWQRKKWDGKTLSLPVCVEHIELAQRKVFMAMLEGARKVEAKNQDPEVRRLLDDLDIGFRKVTAATLLPHHAG